MEIKREMMLIAGLLLLVVILAAAMNYFSASVEGADAGKFVLEDLRTKYTDADIGILKVKESYNENGERYFEVKARVTEEHDSPCPKRSHIYYNYPVQNFVPAPPERITTDSCSICATGTCVLNYPEEAIIASHSLAGASEIYSFLQGNPSAAPTVTEFGPYWTVRWVSDAADYSYEVKIDKNGRVISTERMKRPR